MAVVEILNVSLLPEDSERLLGGHVDAPKVGAEIDVYAVNIEGWVLGKSSAAVAVELVSGGILLRRIPINVRRPDIVAAYDGVPEAESCGFRTTINEITLTTEFELLVQAVLRDESRVPIAVIQGRRRALRSSVQSRLQPLMVTTLGRTGSSWLMLLLAQHPQVVTFEPFKYEPRVGTYWMEIFKTLSEPTSYLQSLRPDLSGEHWWIGDEQTSPMPPMPDNSQIYQWLGRSSIESLAAFCQNRIEEFYEQVSIAGDQVGAHYFAEKYWPDYFVPRMLWELYPHAREILLVRDLRDVICSILGFNKKRGFASFGRELTDSDEKFIHQIRDSALAVLRSWKGRSDKAYLLRYEDLIQRPEATLKSVLDYLDIDSHRTTVQRMLQQARGMTPEVQQRHQTSSDPTASVGRWQRELDPSLQAVCQEAFGDILAEFGYAEPPVQTMGHK
jgi:hypothetical protein